MLVHPFLWDLSAVLLSLFTLFIVLRCKDVLQKLLRLPGIEVIVACGVGTVFAVVIGYTGDIVGQPVVADPISSTDGTGFAASLLSGVVRTWPWNMPWAELFERF